MSTTRTDYNSTQSIFVESNKGFTPTIINPETGEPKDLSDTAVYSTIRFKIYRPVTRELIAQVAGEFLNREEGLVSYTIDDSISTMENAGNWIGNIEFLNLDGRIVDQQQVNFNILQSNAS